MKVIHRYLLQWFFIPYIYNQKYEKHDNLIDTKPKI